MKHSSDGSPIVVAGVDVGGPRKGFHAVALCDKTILDTFSSSEAVKVVDWCISVGAQAVGVDAPCHWSKDGRARRAERELASEGTHSFATPSREKATSANKFFEWMLQGEDLYRYLQISGYRLYDGGDMGSGRLCFETFPHAVARALDPSIKSAKKKSSVRRELLQRIHIDTGSLKNIDTVDAALCAFTAHSLLAGNFKEYGDLEGGLLLVPDGFHRIALIDKKQ